MRLSTAYRGAGCEVKKRLDRPLPYLLYIRANFVLPHASLRQALDEPIPTYRIGSARLWRPCTPAMAAGLTDHVWTLREVLLFRVPPWPQPVMV
jgi:hypothetical protein